MTSLPPRFLPSSLIARRVQQSYCLSILHRLLLTHALALSASQIVRKKKSPRIFTSIHSYQVPADLSLARQLSSAQLNSAAPWGIVQYRALTSVAMRCGAVPCCVLCCTYYFVRGKYHSKHRSRTDTTGSSYYVVESQKMHCQLSSAQLCCTSSAAPCGDVPCPAVKRHAVLRCALVHPVLPGTLQSTRYQVTGMYVCARFFAFVR